VPEFRIGWNAPTDERAGRIAAAALLALVAASACGGSSEPSGTPPPSPAEAARCVVQLHGKGGNGADPATKDGVTTLAPSGNAEGWGGRQWLYFPDAEYAAARDVVSTAAAGCQEVIVGGFSNGAAFAAKLYCRGETFGGRLVGVVVDDPVVDHAVNGCTPDPSVGVTLYWTGALAAQAKPGWTCAEADWTCEGGTTIGIDAYAAALGAPAQASPHHDHQPFVDAPELARWRP